MALSEVKIRAVEATEGVPNETRQHIGEGITDFERILPGPDRMYPDTDSSPVAITKDRLDKLRAVLPDPAYSRDERWMELGLSDELVYSLGRSKFALMYDRLLKRNLTDPVFLAYLFEGYLKNLKRQGRDLIFISDDLLAYILEQTGQRELPNEAVYVALDYLSSNGTNIPLERLFDELNLIPMTESDVSSLIESKAAELDGDRFKSEEKLIEYIIGQVKSETRGKFPPEKLKDMVKEQVKAKHPATS